MKHVTLWLTALVLLALTPMSASAETHVLLCCPGGPGSTADAQPIVDRFLTKLSALAGWDSAKGSYYNNMKACEGEMKASPSVVMVPLDIYLKERAAWKLQPAAVLTNKETSGSYHLVANKGTTLASLAGKTVATALKTDPQFLSRVAFDGKVDVAGFTLSSTRSAFKAIKNVVKGKADAVILDDVQYNSLKGEKWAEGLEAVVSGPSLPGAIVAGVGSTPAKLAASLEQVCKDDQALCKDMRITGFGKVDTAKLTALEGLLKNK